MILKVKDIRNESVEELESKLENMRKKHMELRFSHATGTLKNPLDLQVIRKDITRILNVIIEKKGESRHYTQGLGKKEPIRKIKGLLKRKMAK